VQLADTGIVPGAGVGNKSEKTLINRLTARGYINE